VVEKLEHLVKGVKLVNFGSVMLEEAKAKGWVHHRDELRKLPITKQRALQASSGSRISRMKERVVLVDTHLFIRTSEGFWPGLPFDVVRAMKPTHLVLVEASPDEILGRRAKDRLRYRDSVSGEQLTEEKALARSFLAVSSTLTGAPMLIVNNAEGKADEIASTIARALEKA
jgi:adenylate kinase